MVDVGSKDVTERLARASGRVRMKTDTIRRIREGQMSKGDVLEVARLAAIMAAKQTGTLIPLCHNLSLTSVEVDFEFVDDDCLLVKSTVRTVARTGVEMEALTAVSIAALTIYDMCKAIDREMVVQQVQLDEKSGGVSGHFVRTHE